MAIFCSIRQNFFQSSKPFYLRQLNTNCDLYALCKNMPIINQFLTNRSKTRKAIFRALRLRSLHPPLALGRALVARRRQILQPALQLHMQVQPPRLGLDTQHRDIRPRDVEAHRRRVVVCERARGVKRREGELRRRKNAIYVFIVLLHRADLPRQMHAHGIRARGEHSRLEVGGGHGKFLRGDACGVLYPRSKVCAGFCPEIRRALFLNNIAVWTIAGSIKIASYVAQKSKAQF